MLAYHNLEFKKFKHFMPALDSRVKPEMTGSAPATAAGNRRANGAFWVCAGTAVAFQAPRAGLAQGFQSGVAVLMRSSKSRPGTAISVQSMKNGGQPICWAKKPVGAEARTRGIPIRLVNRAY